MNWLLLMTLLTADTDGIENETIDKKPIEQTTVSRENRVKPASSQLQKPDLELLLFLAEWEDADNDQWLDPEIFATDDSMNQQLDIQKAKQNETDSDPH